MSVQSELEHLKDFLNAEGKSIVDRVLRELAALPVVDPAPSVSVPEPASVPVTEVVDVPHPELRQKERDETSDQRFAEKLGLTK